MGRTYHKVYIQLVFAVKFRKAIIAKEWSQDLFRVIGNLVNEAGGQSLIVNGVSDHVHCLFSLPPSVSISNVMKVAKAKSSRWVNENRLTSMRFEWQRGGGIFSYHVDQVGAGKSLHCRAGGTPRDPFIPSGVPGLVE